MNDSSSSVSPATPLIYTSSRSFSERFSILKRSAKKPNANAGLDTEKQAEIAKPGPNAKAQKTQVSQRRRSLLDTLTEIAKLDDEIDMIGSSPEKGSPLPTESRRRSSMPNLARGRAVCKMLAMINADDSDGEASLFDSDSDDEAFDHNQKGAVMPIAATDSTRSLLFDNDERFKCVDDFITLTTDFDKGATCRPCRRQGIIDQHPSSSTRRRSSIIDSLAALAESTRDLAAGLDDGTLSTSKN
jgi:hypothetical protein